MQTFALCDKRLAVHMKKIYYGNFKGIYGKMYMNAMTTKQAKIMKVYWLPVRLFAQLMLCFFAYCLAAAAVEIVEQADGMTTLSSFSPPAAAWSLVWQGDSATPVLTPVEPERLNIDIEGPEGEAQKGTIIGTAVSGRHLSPSSTLTLTVETFEQPVTLAPALRTDQFYEGPRITLPAHTITSHVFALSEPQYKSATSSWRHEDAVRMEAPVTSLELVLYPESGASYQMDIIDMTLTDTIAQEKRASRIVAPLSFQHVELLTEQPACYRMLEISADLAIVATNPFDPDELSVEVVLLAPSGRQVTCPGFLYAWATESHPYDQWRIRFTPKEAGEWQWKLFARTPGKTIETEVTPLVVAPAEPRGFPRVCTAHPAYFELADERFYYALGHNVCWNSLAEYREQFAAMHAHGENWSRIWIAPWNCELEWMEGIRDYEGLGLYNLRHAEKLDQIMACAEENDLYLQLVLHEHCRVSANTNPEWQNNPLNSANGGPCETPESFFYNEEAKRLTRHRIRYIIARYGHSPNLMAWELFNEVDLSDNFNMVHDTAWHREMAQYIKQTDPHGHMVTTSYITTPNVEVFSLPEIDYTQSHVYTEDIISYLASMYPPYKELNKPHFVAEFGRNTDDGVDGEDLTGQFIHATIWAAFMLPEGGNAMSWWWYDLIDPNQLYYHYAALSRFGEGLDRRDGAWELKTGKTVCETGVELHVMGLCGTDRVNLWLYDPSRLPWSGHPPLAPQAFKGALTITNISDGAWVYEQWNTYEGTVFSKETVTVSNRQAVLPYASAGPDTAIRLIRDDTASTPPEGTPEIILSAWDPTQRIEAKKSMAIPALTAPFKPDGQPKSWEDIPSYTLSGKEKGNDNGMTFWLAHYNADTLYIAAAVNDNQVARRHKAGPDLWKDDCIELWIDARHDADFFNNMPHNPGCWQINLAPSIDTPGRVDNVVYRHPLYNNKSLTNITAASSITPEGYYIEAAIPLDFLRGSAPVENPHVIGLNVSNCDADPEREGNQWQHLLWLGTEEYDARQWGEATLISPQHHMKGTDHGQ
ncbi:MAG: DUF5060 domain-containing protein [Spartobacteria bacterium]|nr:DUF5060 domain-containing protein [Spartobacteria bacterium]